MKKHDYWAKREDEARKNYLKKDKNTFREVNEIYASMLDKTHKEIEAFYGKYAKDEKISISEAKKRVEKLDIERYERKAKEYVKDRDFSKEANAEMKLYNLTMKVNRLELLKANIGLELISGFENLEESGSAALYKRTLEEQTRMAGILGDTVQDNAKAAKQIVEGSFHNATFSERIWMHQDLLRHEIGKQLQIGMIQGKYPRVLAKNITDVFSVSRKSAERLMITELARVQSAAQKDSLVRSGYDEYEFIAEPTACPICKALDGKIYKVEKMMPGENCAPIHPNCRCSVAAHMDEKEFYDWLEKKGKKFQTGGKIISGGKHFEPYDKNSKKEVAAAKAYRRISRENDAERISKITGFSKEHIVQIKRHIFFNKHKKYDGYGTLYPDYDMAVAWERIKSGKYEERDILLLKHELLESQLEKRYNLTIAEAHKMAKEKYDWEAKLNEDLGGKGEKDGLL